MPRRHARQINLRLDEPLRRRLESVAKQREISINHLMRQLLEDGLEIKALQSLAGYMVDFECNVRDVVELNARNTKDIEATFQPFADLRTLIAHFQTDVEKVLLRLMQNIPELRALVRGAPQEREKGGNK